jgi:uncharacterized protein (TIGR02117 family)
VARWRIWLTVFLACLTTPMMFGCAPTLTVPRAVPEEATLFVIAAGWHTEVALPLQALTGPARSLEQDFAGARYLVIGWGQRDYYMAPNPTAADLLRALLPGPSVMLVRPLNGPPSGSSGDVEIVGLHLSQTGLDLLSKYVGSYIEMGANGTPHRIGAGPSGGSIFYASTGEYDASHTCNTWTAEALHAAGLPVDPEGVVFAGQVMRQVRRIPAP